MTALPRPVIIDPVDDPARLTIELEIEQTAIRGIARDPRGRNIRFTGWLGLIGTITELQQRPDDRPADLELDSRRTTSGAGEGGC